MTAADSFLKISTYRSLAQSLPVTTLGLGTVLLGGLIGVTLNQPSLQDDGIPVSLSRVSGAFSLMQSFHGDAKRPVPKLWNQRLGLVRAGNLWKRQGRSIWWQGWSEDGDAYLILPDQLLAADTKNLRKHQVLGLTLLGSDELHRQQLIQRLQRQPERPSQPTSLQRRCMQRLANAPGVFWTSDALAAISGTTAPLLQQGSHGCLGLRLKGNTLHWGGYVGNRAISLAASQPKQGWTFSVSDRQTPPNFDQESLLEVHGARVDLILGTLLSRQIIQEPLESQYGVNQSTRSRLALSPFSLRLQQQTKGAYRAGLQFQAPLPGGAAAWATVLDRVSIRLEERGFQRSHSAKDKAKTADAVIWKDQRSGQDKVVGGWRWLQQPQKPPLLSAGLASLPDAKPFYQALPASSNAALKLNARPRKLMSLRLMNGAWPALLQKADSLHLQIKPAMSSPNLKASGQQAWWEISGQLVLSSAAESSDDSD